MATNSRRSASRRSKARICPGARPTVLESRKLDIPGWRSVRRTKVEATGVTERRLMVVPTGRNAERSGFRDTGRKGSGGGLTIGEGTCLQSLVMVRVAPETGV